MSQPSTHLILVSAQPIPNLTPILDENLRPQKVVMLVSQDMKEAAQALSAIFKPRGIKVESFELNNPWDVEATSELVLAILAEYPEGSIALNATGGTKLMSIAAFEVFRCAKQPVFYVHPETDTLIWLEKGQPPHELADKIKLDEYLRAYGASSVLLDQKHGVTESLRSLTGQLIKGIEYYAQGLAKVNGLAQKAEKNGLQIEIECNYRSEPSLWDMLDLFQNAGFCKLNDQLLSFPDEASRFLVNGGWLEMYVYGLCIDLKQERQLQDLARNIQLNRHQQTAKPVPNEIDVGLLKNNRLHLIECKTKRFHDQDKKTGESADVLYKLNTLRNVYGGQQAKAMLVSFNQLSKPHRDRAKDLKIELCCHKDLQTLKQKLSDWLR